MGILGKKKKKKEKRIFSAQHYEEKKKNSKTDGRGGGGGKGGLMLPFSGQRGWWGGGGGLEASLHLGEGRGRKRGKETRRAELPGIRQSPGSVEEKKRGGGEKWEPRG